MIEKKKSTLLEQFMNSFSDQDKADIMEMEAEALAFNQLRKKKNDVPNPEE